MERALQIPELLYPIFFFCDEYTLSAAACVCKQWSNAASESLWKSLDNIGLANLTNLLAPLVRHNNESFRLGFLDHPTQDGWQQFLRQAKRVQRISYGASIIQVSTLSTDVFSVIAATRPVFHVTPNLKALLWMADNYSSLVPISIFMDSPLLTHLDISVGHAMDRRHFASFLSQIPYRCPHVTNLSLGFAVPIHAIQAQVLDMLEQMRGLRELELPGFCFAKEVLTCVSSFPLVERFATRPIASEEPHGDINDVLDLHNALPLRADSFPALHSLRFDATLSTSHALLADHQLPRTLRSLFVATLPTQVEDPDAVKEFLSFLATEFPQIDDLGLGLLSGPPPVAPPSPPMTFASLRPMLAMRKIERFYCSFNLAIPLVDDDIREMGRAWGNKLRVLWFWSPLYTTALNAAGVATVVPPPTTLTIASLGVFAEAFPHLTDLGVYLDARHTPELSELPDGLPDISGPHPAPRKTPHFEHLHELGIGISPIDSAHTLSVAMWLAEYVQHDFNLMTDTGWSAEYARLDEEGKKILAELEVLWDDVQGAHRQLWPVRRARREKEENTREAFEQLMRVKEDLEMRLEDLANQLGMRGPSALPDGDAGRS